MATFPCLHCEAAISPPELLTRDLRYLAPCRRFAAPCPRCGKDLEFQVARGRIDLGFTYAAGSLHFEPMVSHRVAGLRVVRMGDAAAIDFAGQRYNARS